MNSAPAVLLRQWLWPVFVFLFPLFAWPTQGSVGEANFARMALTGVFVMVGFFLEIFLHPELRLSDVRHLPNLALKHPMPFLAIAFGLWTLVVSAFAPVPVFSFLGVQENYSDAALWVCLLAILFCLVYIRATQDLDLPKLMVGGVVIAGILLVAIAVTQVVFVRGIFIPGDYQLTDLPLGMFYSRGHLAGFLLISTGAMLVFLFRGFGSWIYFFALCFLCFGIGLTANRAAVLGIVLVLIFGWFFSKRTTAVAGLVVLLGLGVGWWVIDFSATRDHIKINDATGRYELWKAAMAGIAKRPVVGYGAGQFQNYWYKFLSKKEMQRALSVTSTAKGEFVEVINPSGAYPYFVSRSPVSNKLEFRTMAAFKAHNQILDLMLMWGLPSVLLCGMFFVSLFPGLQKFNALAVALCAYAVFLMFWYLPLTTEATLCALWAAGCAGFGNKNWRSNI